MKWFARHHFYPDRTSEVELVAYRAEQRLPGEENQSPESRQLEKVLNRELPHGKPRIRKKLDRSGL